MFKSNLNQCNFLFPTIILVLAAMIMTTAGQGVRAGELGAGELESLITDDVTYAVLLDEVRPLIREGKVEAALERLKESYKVHPNVPEPDVQVASLLFEIRSANEAKRYLERAASKDPDSFELHIAFAKLAVAEERWFDAWSHVELAKSRTDSLNWSSKFSKRVRTNMLDLLATIAIGRKDWASALERLETLRRTQADQFARQLDLASVAIVLGKTNLAESVCAELAREKDSVSAEILLARLFVSVGKSNAAHETFAKAASRNDGDASLARLEHGRLLLSENRPNEALAKFKAIEQASDEAKFHQSLCHLMMGDFATAESLLTVLHQSDPSNFQYGNYLALALIEDSDEAKRARAGQIASANFSRIRSTRTLTTLGWVRYRLGEMRMGEDLLKQAIGQPDAPADAFAYLATLRHRSGHAESAKQLASMAQARPGPRYCRPVLESP